jgi:hypothetical protein
MALLLVGLFSLLFVIETQPFTTQLQNRLEVFNEVTILATSYFLIMFTNFVPEPQTRYLMGFYLSGIILLNVGTNMLVLIKEKVQPAMLKFK